MLLLSIKAVQSKLGCLQLKKKKRKKKTKKDQQQNKIKKQQRIETGAVRVKTKRKQLQENVYNIG